jgi:hypothetical protein
MTETRQIAPNKVNTTEAVLSRRGAVWNVWRYDYQKAFLIREYLRFKIGYLAEDLDFTARVYSLTNVHIRFVHVPYYVYCHGRAGSITETASYRFIECVTELIKTNEERIKHVPSIMPLSYKQMKGTSSGFGMRVHPIYGNLRRHTGIDLNANVGTPVYATGNGTVEAAGWEGGYGYTVLINHGFGYKTRYGHCYELKVRAGQKVVRGQEIATVGATGAATGPHLHYEVLVKEQYDNPAKYFFMNLTPEEYEQILFEAENR